MKKQGQNSCMDSMWKDFELDQTLCEFENNGIVIGNNSKTPFC